MIKTQYATSRTYTEQGLSVSKLRGVPGFVPTHIRFTHEGDIEEMVVYPYSVNNLVARVEPQEDKHQRQGYQAPQSSQRLRRVALGRREGRRHPSARGHSRKKARRGASYPRTSRNGGGWHRPTFTFPSAGADPRMFPSAAIREILYLAVYHNAGRPY